MRELKRARVATIFVSHNLDMVSKVCDQVLLLQRGKIKAHGDPGKVIGQYFDSVAEEKVGELEAGHRKAAIESVQLPDGHGGPANAFGGR